MDVSIHFSSLILIVFILKDIYQFSLAADPPDMILSEDDVSKYSSIFLSGMQRFPSVKMGELMVYGLELEEPPNNNQIMNAARQIIGENLEVMKIAKVELVTLLQKENPELRFPRENSAWLIRFLRARKYDVPKTRDLILRYYEFKRENKKNIYDKMLPTNEKNTFESNLVTILPTRDGAGRRILLVRTKDWNPQQYPFVEIMKVMIILAEFGMYEPTTQLAGVQIILDADGVHTGHAFAILGLVGKLFDWVLHCVPLHFEGIHVVNDGYKFKIAYNIVKNFLPVEVQNMIHTYGRDRLSLYSKIPRSSLPSIYGGSFPMYTIPGEYWDVLLAYEDHEYKEIDSYGFTTSANVIKKHRNKNTEGTSIISQQDSIEKPTSSRITEKKGSRSLFSKFTSRQRANDNEDEDK